MFLCPKNKNKIKPINLLRKYFSSGRYKDHNKDKRLNDFFKLPKHDIGIEKMTDNALQNEVREQLEELSALNSYKKNNSNGHISLDRQDLIERQVKLAEKTRLSNYNKFFDNSTEQETIKITENLIERARLKKEFEYTDEFKKK